MYFFNSMCILLSNFRKKKTCPYAQTTIHFRRVKNTYSFLPLRSAYFCIIFLQLTLCREYQVSKMNILPRSTTRNLKRSKRRIKLTSVSCYMSTGCSTIPSSDKYTLHYWITNVRFANARHTRRKVVSSRTRCISVNTWSSFMGGPR